MDPISAGASVIAFITLSLKTAKTIHQALSSFKGAPETVEELAQDVKSVSVVLGRLSQCSFAGSSETTITALRSQVACCDRELSSISSRVQSFDASSSGRPARLWKNIRAAWKEKELDQTRNRIRDHSAQLSVYLSLIQIEASSNTTSTITTHTANTEKTLQDILQGIAKINNRLDTDANRSEENDAAVDTAGPVSGIVEEEVMHACNDLEDSVARLSALAHEDGSLLEAEDAEQIMDDLQRLVQTARDRVCAKTPETTSATNEKRWATHKALNLISSMILSAPIIAINQPVRGLKRKATVDANDSRIETERCWDKVETSSGTLTLQAKKRRRCNSHGTSMASSRAVTSKREVVATITFRPTTFSSSISISVTQGQLFDRSVQTIPRIAINPIISKDSYVWQVVLQDDPEKLRMLLADGTANIRDHDEKGRGLLHYCHDSPKVCKFLIEAGIDVNGWGSSSFSPLSALLFGGDDYPTETAEILLRAGADLVPNDRDTVLLPIVIQGDAYILRLIAKCNSSLEYEINTSDEDGWTLLHFALTIHREKDWSEIVELLLSLGANIHARTSSEQTCLHLFFQNPTPLFRPANLTCQGSLVNLVSQGADVNAVDSLGKSVTDLAHSCSGFYSDLWDSVLAICGYDLHSFRKKRRREPRYNEKYTRDVFESLWKGREHLCPYWDDAPWPSDGASGDDSDYDSDSDALLSFSESNDSAGSDVQDDSEMDSEKPNLPENGLMSRAVDAPSHLFDSGSSPQYSDEGSTDSNTENRSRQQILRSWLRQDTGNKDKVLNWLDSNSGLLVERDPGGIVLEEDLLRNPWAE